MLFRSDADELCRFGDAVEVGVENRQALRGTVLVDKDKRGTSNAVCTADASDDAFAEVGFAGAQITTEKHDVAACEQCAELRADGDGVVDAGTGELYVACVHDAIVARSAGIHLRTHTGCGTMAPVAVVVKKVTDMTHKRYERYVWGVLAYTILVILWGAFVRATGSGAGCGNHWPLCNGEVIPRAPMLETIIEISHRLTSGVLLILVLGVTIFSFRLFPKGHIVRVGGVLSIVFVIEIGRAHV